MITGACVLILILSVALISVPLSLELKIDFKRNDGFAKFRVFKFLVVDERLYFKHIRAFENDLVIDKKGKKEEFHINADKFDRRSILRLLNIEFVPKINFRDIVVNLSLGKKDDALFTTFVVVALRIILCSIFAKFSVNNSVTVIQNYFPEYNEDAIAFDIKARASVTLGELVNSLIVYIGKKIKERKKSDYSTRRASD